MSPRVSTDDVHSEDDSVLRKSQELVFRRGVYRDLSAVLAGRLIIFLSIMVKLSRLIPRLSSVLRFEIMYGVSKRLGPRKGRKELTTRVTQLWQLCNVWL